MKKLMKYLLCSGLVLAACGDDSASNANAEEKSDAKNPKGFEIFCDEANEGFVIKPVDSKNPRVCKSGEWVEVEDSFSSAAEPVSSSGKSSSSKKVAASSSSVKKASSSSTKTATSSSAKKVASSSATVKRSSSSVAIVVSSSAGTKVSSSSADAHSLPTSSTTVASSSSNMSSAEVAQSSSSVVSSSTEVVSSSSEVHVYHCDDGEIYVLDLNHCEKISSSSVAGSSDANSSAEPASSAATSSSSAAVSSSSVVSSSSPASSAAISSAVVASSSSVVSSSSVAVSSSSVISSSSPTSSAAISSAVVASSSSVVSSSSIAVSNSSITSSSSEESSSSVLEIHRTWSSQAVVKNMPAGTYDCNVYNCRPTTFLSPSRLKENEFGEVLDTRDNQVYRTKILSDIFTDTLGKSRTINQTWFVQDLNYDYEIDAMEKCVAVGCDKEYGRLYAWAAAMDTLVTGCGGKARSATCNKGEKHQGLCPTGWHVPDSAEVALLKHYIASWLLKYATIAEAGYYLKKAGHLSYEYTQCRWPWVATGGWATKRENDSYCQHSEDMDLFGLAFLPEDFTDKDESTIGDWSQSSCFWLSNDGVLKKNTNAQAACFDGFGAVINTGSSTNSPGVHIAPDKNGNYSKTYIRCLKDEDNI